MRRVSAGLLLVASSGLAGCEPDPQEVRIVAEEYRFLPSSLRVAAGRRLELVLVNAGRERHEFASPLLASADPPAQAFVPLAPGRQVRIALHPPAGTHPFRCRIPGHQGMAGTMIVEAPGD